MWYSSEFTSGHTGRSWSAHVHRLTVPRSYKERRSFNWSDGVTLRGNMAGYPATFSGSCPDLKQISAASRVPAPHMM